MDIESVIDEARTFIVHQEHTIRLQYREERVALPEGGTLGWSRFTPLGSRPVGQVILVHGFAQNHATWHGSKRSFAAYLAGEGLDVLNLDLPGHGRSRPLAGTMRGFERYTSAILGLVAQLDGPCVLIGHSLGGAACVASAAQCEALRGVVSIAGVSDFARHNAALRAIARVTSPLSRGPLRVNTSMAGRLMGRLFRLSDAAGFVVPLSGWAPGSMERDILEERLSDGFDWADVGIWGEMTEWADRGYSPEVEQGIACEVPMLFVAGDQDPLVTLADTRSAYERCSSADRTLLALEPYNTGLHWGHIDLILGRDAPQFVWQPIVEWVKRRL